MFDLVSVTHRGLCTDDLPRRVGQLCRGGISRVILREKDLSEAEYEALARRVLAAGGDKVVLHHFPQVCQRLGVPRLHLSLKELEACPQLRDRVELLGVSVHAPEEAVRAQALGADYVTAGHVFDTDCKKGLPGRGLDFLRAVCGSVDIPVYAIGGIGPDNLADVARTGAAGACLMSGLMTCPHPAETVGELLARLA
ncbi:thiamine phosphate synthase [uncultured Flavonifractor sp.]|uniref:thiamine phosphate synthase n=1 Tax=uncultured Flavonifractor sp. TaxID=1193534 RepID=UPI002634C021|nr:thiamine phosphate synthase [uncultured Flavonifractor sp.]